MLHSMNCLAPPASTAIATSAMRLHGVPLDLLKDQLRGNRSGPALKALHQLDLRAESIVEVDAQHLFTANGIGYDTQVALRGIGRVDFLIEGFLIVEVDGFAFHSSREAMRRDLGRNNASTLAGFAVLRCLSDVPARLFPGTRPVALGLPGFADWNEKPGLIDLGGNAQAASTSQADAQASCPGDRMMRR